MKDLLFPSEIGRISFLIRLVLLLVVLTLIVVVLPLPDSSPEREQTIWLVAIPFAIYNLLFISLPRIRDIGFPSWFAIFALIPYLNGILFLLLVFAPKRKSFLGASLGSPSAITVPSASPEKISVTRPTSVAGSNCSKCGDKLMLSRDGEFNENGEVVCNDCLVGGAHST
ncbi:MAG TPA: hypothetical protein PLA50_09785 [Bacteroidia bacterium]|nr:hypothetical protein [Bacteroidia bacterium]